MIFDAARFIQSLSLERSVSMEYKLVVGEIYQVERDVTVIRRRVGTSRFPVHEPQFQP